MAATAAHHGPVLLLARSDRSAERARETVENTLARLGAGHPMGPLALLDLVGLDVSKAIGETIGERAPERVDQLIDEGALGRKSGRGFFRY